MLVRDVLLQSSGSKEDEHFSKRDSEWIKRMQKQAAREVERGQMGDEIGVADPKILQDLQELGYSRHTVKLVSLAPLVQVAWSDGHVTERERKRILELAKVRSIEEGSLAYSQLSEWLSQRPRLEFFEKTLSVIRNLLQVMPVEHRQVIKETLVSRCTYIAAASGGLWGFGQTISDTEQALLKHITDELEDPQNTAA